MLSSPTPKLCSNTGPAWVNIKATKVWYHIHPVRSPQDVLSYATALNDSHNYCSIDRTAFLLTLSKCANLVKESRESDQLFPAPPPETA